MIPVLLNILLVVLDAGVAHYFVQMPNLQADGRLFGVGLNQEDFGQEATTLLKKYRVRIWILFVIIEGAATMVSLTLARSKFDIASIAVPRIGALLGVAIASCLLYTLFARRMAEFEIPEQSIAIASSLITRRLRDYTQPGLELAIVLVTLAPILLLAISYASMPERIPWHINSQGEIDGWLEKGIGAVFCVPILVLYAQGWFLLLKHGCIRGTFTLPAARTEEYLKLKFESFKIVMRSLDWLRFAFAVPLVFLAPLLIFRTTPNANLWMVSGVVFGILWGVCVLVGMNHYDKRLRLVNKRLETEAGRSYVPRQTDQGHWRLGKLFINDPESPAIFVESPVGPSWVLNLGNRWSIVHIGYLIGFVPLIIGVLWLW